MEFLALKRTIWGPPARSPSCLSPQNPHTLLVFDLTLLVGAVRLGKRCMRPGAALPPTRLRPTLSPACAPLRAHILCCLHLSIVSPTLEEGRVKFSHWEQEGNRDKDPPLTPRLALDCLEAKARRQSLTQ